MRFIKMHGIGNDYVYIDCFREIVSEPEKLAVRISDRHFGVEQMSDVPDIVRWAKLLIERPRPAQLD